MKYLLISAKLRAEVANSSSLSGHSSTSGRHPVKSLREPGEDSLTVACAPSGDVLAGRLTFSLPVALRERQAQVRLGALPARSRTARKYCSE